METRGMGSQGRLVGIPGWVPFGIPRWAPPKAQDGLLGRKGRAHQILVHTKLSQNGPKSVFHIVRWAGHLKTLSTFVLLLNFVRQSRLFLILAFNCNKIECSNEKKD